MMSFIVLALLLQVPRSYITLYRRFTNPKRRDNPAAPLLSKVGLDGIMTNKEVMEIFNLSDDVKRDMLNEEEIVKGNNRCSLPQANTFVTH